MTALKQFERTRVNAESGGIELLTWYDSREIAALLNEKFPRVDVLSLTDSKLLDMMKESGILESLQEFEEGKWKKADALFAVKCALTRVMENDSDYNAREGDAYV